MNYVKINAATLWFIISLIKTETNSHSTTCDNCRQRRLLPPDHRYTPRNKVNRTDKVYCNVPYSYCFLLPKTVEVS